jgi:RNA polymerase sigma-70 factor, ECF subfamily
MNQFFGYPSTANHPSLMSKRLSQVSLSLVAGTNRQDISDVELAHGLVAGEGWAIGATWHRFAPMVLTMAERSLGSRTDAEDLAQEVFLAVFRKAKTLREPEKLRSFVYSFATFALKSELRRRKLRGWLSFLTPEALVDVGFHTVDVESRDLLRRFYALLDRLSPRDRLVFSLKELESLTLEEIATVMDISVSTVKRSLRLATTRLSRWILVDPGLASAFGTLRWQQ